ncbi:MAG: serine/threonine protein kinase [Bryobacter sp.]|nr:serine/threonine protein kinase [Bryobacter sp.]
MTQMQKVASYDILETLEGGPRPLYKARGASGVVALKTMPTQGVSDEERARFLREAEVTRGLDHPNLLPVSDSGESDGVLYMAMELLEGMDLRKALAAGRTGGWPERLSIMEQVLDGLAIAHGRGLVHRDIKPANIFLENSGRVRLLDFGMARVSASTLTRAGASVGTLNYMAPEQLRGEPCVPATDLFAAAVVFHELATGRHPFSSGETNLAKVLSNIMFLAAPALDAAIGAPEGLQQVLAHALEKDPAKRTQSAEQFRRELAICRLMLELGAQSVTRTAEHAQPAAAAEEDLAKTRVIRRQPAPPPAPLEVAEKAAPVVPPKRAASTPVVYCPNCTETNPIGAAVCRRCSLPLTATSKQESGSTRKSGLPAWVWLIPVLLGALAVAWWVSGGSR